MVLFPLIGVVSILTVGVIDNVRMSQKYDMSTCKESGVQAGRAVQGTGRVCQLKKK